MRIAFLTRSLETGGAERQLVLLARGLARRGHAVMVLAMYPGGALAGELAGSGVELEELHKRGRWDLAGFLGRLRGRLRAWRPRVVHSYLDAPNLLSAALRPALPGVKVVWGVRDALEDLSAYDLFPRLVHRLTYPLSPLAHAVIVNSRAARELHLAKGMRPRRLAVIPNGIDTDRFAFDPAGRERLRAAWGVGPEEALVGLAARLDPKKDHAGFLRAARLIHENAPEARFVCIGGGAGELRQRLQGQARELGLEQVVTWAGEVGDMPAAYSALEVAVSASYGESFPNTVAEAMACARPVVVTDAGDSAELVGPAGRVVRPRDPEALAAACLELLARPAGQRRALGARLRARVAERYSVEAMVEASEAFLQDLVGGRG